jgi:serine/threonine-protein kinase RsbW
MNAQQIQTDAVPSAPGAPNPPVTLRLPADAAHLPVVRAVANAVATRADFDLDTISDITMAVDELCSQLIVRAVRGSALECTFGMPADILRIHGFVTAADDMPLSTASFGWRVLATLTDHARSWLTEAPDGVELHIEVEKAVVPTRQQ